jgi:hypothetical protein
VTAASEATRRNVVHVLAEPIKEIRAASHGTYGEAPASRNSFRIRRHETLELIDSY